MVNIVVLCFTSSLYLACRCFPECVAYEAEDAATDSAAAAKPAAKPKKKKDDSASLLAEGLANMKVAKPKK